MAAAWVSLMGGELVGLTEAGGETVSADLAGFLVGGPAGADEVAADDALDGEGFEFAHDHGAQLQVAVGDAAAGEFSGLVGEKVVGDERGGLGEPPVADLREDDALAGDAVREDDIEGGEAVGGGEQEGVAEVEDLADLARGDARERQAVDGSDGAGGQGGGDLGGSHGSA